MGSGEDWDAEKMFQLYLHDYMVKKNMHTAADIFAREANVCSNPVVIDVPGGFLSEWWSIFYDTYNSRQGSQHETGEGSSVKMDAAMQENKPQVSSSLMPPAEMNQSSHGQLPTSIDFNKMMAQPSASMMTPKMYEEEHLRKIRNSDPSLCVLDVDKLRISTSSTKIASSSQQQMSRQAQQQGARETRDARRSSNLGKTLTGDPTLYGVPRSILPRDGSSGSVVNNGVNPVSLRGWSLTGVDQNPQRLGHPLLSSLLQEPYHEQQIQRSRAHQQELMGQVLAYTPGNPMFSQFRSPPTSDLETRNKILPRRDSHGKEELMMPQTKQTAGHQCRQDQLQQQQQLQESDRKRKTSAHSHPGESGLDFLCLEDKPQEENVESFLSHDAVADFLSTPFSILQRSSASSSSIENKDFCFEEVGHFTSSNTKVLCCNFSSNGDLLASAGHEKNVMIWNMKTLEHVNTTEGHGHLITDVRFKPSSSVFATSSFDKTVKIWDAARPCRPLANLSGHVEQVMSLDFHPRNSYILCSCDTDSEIRLWNVNSYGCTRVTKGANRQVRFQPEVGKLLAAAAGNGVSVIDVETDCMLFHLKGHAKEVRSICWDTSGEFIATVSEDCARVWSAASDGRCIHELHSHGSKFESCVFHPGHPLLLVVGGYQSLQLWDPTESNKTMTVQAHSGIIAALTDSPQTQIIASASHDHSVKLWK